MAPWPHEKKRASLTQLSANVYIRRNKKMMYLIIVCGGSLLRILGMRIANYDFCLRSVSDS